MNRLKLKDVRETLLLRTPEGRENRGAMRGGGHGVKQTSSYLCLKSLFLSNEERREERREC